MKKSNLIGQRFGRLIIIEQAKKPDGSKILGSLWLCKCDCGNEKVIRGASLAQGLTKSCGCYRKEMEIEGGKNSRGNIKDLGVASFNHYFNQYKFSAKYRKLEFNLTKEQFRSLTKSDCFYCGVEPTRKVNRSITLTNKYLYNGDYICNGLDRIDNNIGYTVENCVPCCTRCNSMKEKLSASEFLSHIEKIYNHRKQGVSC